MDFKCNNQLSWGKLIISLWKLDWIKVQWKGGNLVKPNITRYIFGSSVIYNWRFKLKMLLWGLKNLKILILSILFRFFKFGKHGILFLAVMTIQIQF